MWTQISSHYWSVFTCDKLRVQNVLENALEKLSEGLKLQNFPGGACPQTPLAFARYARVKRVFTCLLSAPLLKNIFLRHCEMADNSCYENSKSSNALEMNIYESIADWECIVINYYNGVNTLFSVTSKI